MVDLDGGRPFDCDDKERSEHTTASHGALIIATIPLFTEIVAAIRTRRRPPSMVLLGSSVALAGVTGVVDPGAGKAALLVGLLMFDAVST